MPLPTISAAKTSRRKESDFLVAIWDHRYNFAAVTLTNASGGDIDFQPGEILDFVTDHYEPTSAANKGDCILCTDLGILADEASARVRVLLRGPAIVNTDRLFVQAAATKATVLTDLATSMNPKVVFITEPTVVQTGPLV